MPDYLSVLNPEQRAAVEHTSRPLLILAGAGSGKTRVITTKIAYLIREKGIDPKSILAVTFTNKAAREMRERACRIDNRANETMLRTFHSFGAWFLRRNGLAHGLNPDFSIYDDDDAASLVHTLTPDIQRAEARSIASKIARAKDYFFNPDSPELAMIDHTRFFRTVYSRYEEKLREIGNVDFGDLIKKPVEILRSNPNIKARINERFKVIMVDEYQDANIAQFELLRELYSENAYICVVGDDDQSIYSFRGAEVQNILQFSGKFDGVDTIRLVRNYRSFSPILELAGAVVQNNTGRLGKELVAERGIDKIKKSVPRVVFVENQDIETRFCANLIEKAADTGGAYSDWAVLYRTNAQSLGFESEFLRRKIPYRVIGSLKFYEREEIKDALSLLALLVNPKDIIAFRRIVNKPVKGIGAASIDEIINYAIKNTSGDLLTALSEIKSGFSSRGRKGAELFLSVFEKAAKLLNNIENDAELNENYENEKLKDKTEIIKWSAGLSRITAFLIEASGLAEYMRNNDEQRGESRLGNLQELVNFASLYEASRTGLRDFLESIELDRDTERENPGEITDTVTLITLHNTKGLEFQKVIITGVEQGIFPRWDKTGVELEEERRLFYVGVTRAKDELYITCSALRRVFGETKLMQPSIFLKEAYDAGADIKLIGDSPF